MSTISSITQRELEILKLVSFEYRSIDIAEKLFISEHTVITHRKNLMEKLKVRNTAGLVRRGFELDYLSSINIGDLAL